MSLHAARMTTYDAARSEVMNHLRAMRSWTGPSAEGTQPMEIDALTKGKGKGKSKTKSKDKGSKTDEVCFYCAKPGHRKRECRFYRQDRKDKKVHSDMAGKFKGQAVEKDGSRKKKDGKEKDGELAVLEHEGEGDDDLPLLIFPLTEDLSTPFETYCPEPASAEADDLPLHILPLTGGASRKVVLFDTCAARSACPPTFAKNSPVLESTEIPLAQADGTRVKHYGEKKVSMTAETMRLSGRFDVKGVSKPIMAAGSVVDAGHGVWLHRGGSMIIHADRAEQIHGSVARLAEGKTIDLERQRGIFVMRLGIDGEAEDDPICPVEIIDEDEEPTQEPEPPMESEQALPFRSWCAACVRARARDDPHKVRGSEQSTIPVVSLDYCFLNREDEQETATVLVMNLRPHGAAGAVQVPNKGASEFAVDSVLHYLDLWGLTAVVLKTDQENSVLAVVAEVKKRRTQPTSVEMSPKGSHQSNGPAEQEVGRVEGLVRTIMVALQARYKVKVTAKSLVLPWIVRHAAFLLTRFVVGEDGRSA